MQKLITSIITVGLLLTTLVLVAFFRFDYTTFSKNFLKNINIEPIKNDISKIQLNFTPLPTITISAIETLNKVHIEELKIRPSLLSLILFNPKIDSININDMKIYSEVSKFNLTEHDKFFGELLKNKFFTIDSFIKNFTILDQEGSKLLYMKNIKINNKSNFTIEFDNAILEGKIEYDNNKQILNLKLSNNDYAVTLNESYEDGNLVQGEGDMVIQSIPYSLGSIYPPLKLNDIKTKIHIAEGIKCNFSLTRDKEFLNFKDIKITTPSDKISGVGEISLTQDNASISNINLHFDKINLDVSNFIENTNSNNFFSNSEKLDINVDIDNGAIKTEKFTNIKFKAKANNGQLEIENFAGNFSSGGDFFVKGNMIQQDTHNVLNGQISLNYNNLAKFLSLFGIISDGDMHQPFTLQSDFKLSTVDLFLDNILLKNTDTQITGNIHSQYIGSIPRISGKLEFLFNSEDPSPIIYNGVNLVKSLFSDMKKDEYLNKFIPIRTINTIGNMDLTFNNAIFKNKKFDKIRLSVVFNPGKITVNDFFINNDKNFLNASAILDASAVKPTFYIEIKDGIVPLNFLRKQSITDFYDFVLKDYDLSKFNMTIKGLISELSDGDRKIQKVNFELSNNNNLITVSNFTGEVFGGNVVLKGSILMDTYNFNFVYALNDINLTELPPLIPKQVYNGESGVLSTNGMFSTYGDNLEKLLYNFYTKSSFIAKDIKLKEISIDDFVTKFNNNQDELKNIDDLLQNMLLTGETMLGLLQGNIEMNRGDVFFSNVNFKSAYSSGTVSGDLNIYKFLLNIDSIVDFVYVNQDNQTINLPIKVEGDYFQPAKSVDSKNLKQILLQEQQQ